VEKGRFDLAAAMNADDCISCGSCSYVCPARRPVSHFIKLARQSKKSGT
jgi:electron transport complex protein RnfC